MHTTILKRRQNMPMTASNDNILYQFVSQPAIYAAI